MFDLLKARVDCKKLHAGYEAKSKAAKLKSKAAKLQPGRKSRTRVQSLQGRYEATSRYECDERSELQSN
jgi:hypothetical protein